MFSPPPPAPPAPPGPPAPSPPEEEALGLLVPQEPGAGDDGPQAGGQVEGDLQLAELILTARAEILVPTVSVPLERRGGEAHLTDLHSQADEHDEEHKAYDTPEEGDTIGGALGPGGGVGGEDAVLATLPDTEEVRRWSLQHLAFSHL